MNERLPQKWGKKRHWRMSLAFNYYYPSIEAKLSKLGYIHKKHSIFTKIPPKKYFFLFFESLFTVKLFESFWLSHWVIVFLKNQTCHENKLDHTFSQSKKRLKEQDFEWSRELKTKEKLYKRATSSLAELLSAQRKQPFPFKNWPLCKILLQSSNLQYKCSFGHLNVVKTVFCVLHTYW